MTGPITRDPFFDTRLFLHVDFFSASSDFDV